MTLKEVRELLRNSEADAVVEQMRDWHPVILGQMLLAVQQAKELRTRLYHPDYANPLLKIYEREKKLWKVSKSLTEE